MSIDQEFWKQQEEQFKHRLSLFEERIETPFVPGELDQWFGDTQEAWKDLDPQLELHTQTIHADEFAEIVEEDSELLARVEEMREEDQSLTAIREQIQDSLDELSQRRDEGASETDLKQDLDQFVATCLDFVTRLRKQEVSVRTWLMEAFLRDRGTVD